MNNVMFKVFERLLCEAIIDDLEKKFSKNTSMFLSDLSDYLPQRLYAKFLPWAARLFEKFGHYNDSDIDAQHAAAAMLAFDKYQQAFVKKDINQYESFAELVDATRQVLMNRKTPTVAKAERDVIYESDDWIMIVPRTQNAMCKYGSNTKWCVAAKHSNNLFARYMGYSIIFVLIQKDTQKKFGILVNVAGGKIRHAVDDDDNVIKNTITSEIKDELDQNVSFEQLQMLVGDEWTHLYERIVSYAKKNQATSKRNEIGSLEDPKTSPEILRKYSNSDVLDIRQYVALNPSTPVDVLYNLAGDEIPRIRFAVARNPSTPIDVLKLLASDSNWGVKFWAAQNPKLPIENLRMLADDKHAGIRRAVAGNMSTPMDVVKKLVRDQDENVRFYAKKHLHTLARI